jgi:hypothetical protein
MQTKTRAHAHKNAHTRHHNKGSTHIQGVATHRGPCGQVFAKTVAEDTAAAPGSAAEQEEAMVGGAVVVQASVFASAAVVGRILAPVP